MNPVAQEHELGCGIACVAYVAAKSYQEMVNILGIESGKADNKGFACKELVAVLEKIGHSYIYKYIKPRIRKKIYTQHTIVFIKRSKRYPYGHYLFYHDGLWMDPWINFTTQKNVAHAKGGFRKRLPGTPIYALLKKNDE